MTISSSIVQKDEIELTSSVMEVLNMINLHPPLPMGAIFLNDNQMQILRRNDKVGNNCLLNAASSGDLEVIKLLICCGIDVNCENPKTKQKAIDVAWDNGCYDIMLLLLKADSEYPNGFELSHLENELIPEEFKLFIKERESISDWIKNNDLKKIINVVSKYPCSKLLNTKNCLALEVAARCGTVSVLSILLGLEIKHPEEVYVNLTNKFSNLLNNTINNNGDTLLAIAAENGNEACVRFLISCKVNVNHKNENENSVKFGRKAVDLAWSNKHFNIVLTLLKADSEFPEGFCVRYLSEGDSSQLELSHFAQQMTELHVLIEKDDWGQIESILNKVKLKLYLNTKGQSAAFTAAQRKNFVILSRLRSIGVDFKDDIERSLLEKLSEFEKDSFKEAMIPYFPSLENSHIYSLIAKSRSHKSFDLSNDRIKTFFEKLNNIPEVSKILQVVQYADYLDIVFDFGNENIKVINPTASDFTKGTTDYKEGRLYIAGKVDEASVLGTLAHELTHLAMEMVFSNDCNPYKSDDKSLTEKFKKITESIQNNESINKVLRGDIDLSVTDSPIGILAAAFRYKQNEIQSELIVRVPHLLSQFENLGKEWFCSEHKYLCPLFEYYTNEVMVSCDTFIAQSFFIKPRNTVKSLNESVGLVNRIKLSNVFFKEAVNLKDLINNLYGLKFIIYYTQSTWLGILNIYQSLQNNSIPDSAYLILNFSNYLNHYVEIDKAFYSNVCTLLILEYNINSDSQFLIKHMLKWINLVKEKPNKYIILVIHEQKVDLFQKHLYENEFCSYRKLNNYTLNDISTKSQNYLLNKTIIFQGEKMSLINILDQHEISQVRVDGEILTKLILNEEFDVGKRPSEDFISSDYYKCYINRMIDLKIEIDKEIMHDKREEEFNEDIVFSEEDFINLCNEKENVHWFDKYKDNFIWKKSKGPISALLKYKIKRKSYKLGNASTENYLISENDLLKSADEGKIIIISDAAGMGKTTLLSNISINLKKLKPMSWVYRINLNHFTNSFEKELKKWKISKKLHFDSSDEAIDFLLEKLLGLNLHFSPENNFERKLLDYHLKVKSNVILLLDGFDEICPDYTKIVMSLIVALQSKVERLVVTTRSHMSMSLESELGVFAFTLSPLSYTEQTNFLVQYWNTYNPIFTDTKRLEVYSSKLIQLFNDSIKDQFKEFTGIPLQCRMIAEIFEKEIEVPDFFCNLQDYDKFDINVGQSLHDFYVSSQDQPLLEKKLDILDLFNLFIFKKYCDIYEAEKNLAVLSNLGTKKSIKKSYPAFIDEHIELSLQCVFTKTLLKNLGHKMKIEFLINDIIEGEERRGFVDQVIAGNIVFVHKIFAEYFIAKFLVRHLIDGELQKCTKIQQFLLTKILTKPEYVLIRTFFNEYLMKISPINTKLLQSYGSKICYLWSRKQLFNCLEDTPLHLATSEVCFYIADFILNSLEDKECTQCRAELLNFQNKIGYTPLHYAAENGNIEIIKLLVRYGADVNTAAESTKKKFGKTVLYIAAEGGHSNIVKWLVENSGDVNLHQKGNPLYSGMTMLHLAAYIGDLMVAHLLVENGADTTAVVNEGLYSGLMPLHLSAMRGQWDFAKWLITVCKVDINALATSGKFCGSSIFVWAPSEHIVFLKMHGANIDATDENGCTALHIAAQKNDWDSTVLLVDNNANINAKNNLGLTPLHIQAALTIEKDDFIEWLVEHGADIYATDNDGYTPLHAASFSGSISRVKTLMKYVFNGVGKVP